MLYRLTPLSFPGLVNAALFDVSCVAPAELRVYSIQLKLVF